MEKPKIAIIGYGSMGKEIEHISTEQDFIITEVFDIDSKINPDKDYTFDVAIDFTYPEAVFKNVEILASMKKSIVIGTTGWGDKKEEIQEIVSSSGVGCVWGSNFSLGMSMFNKILRQAARVLNKTEGYDIFMHEMHHYKKKDSPSGTAISLARIILDELSYKEDIVVDRQKGEIGLGDLHVSSSRGGEITGTHTIFIDSIADTIELTHRAKNRTGFALGAVTAANWIHGKTGFYNFGKVFDSILKGENV